MDMSKLRRELDSIKGGMEDINSLLIQTDNASKNMVQRLADLSSIGNKGGIVRSIITRATAGIPSVYQIMQQLSSLLLVFKYLTVARNADLKKEQEMIDALKTRDALQRKMFALQEAISKSKSGDLSALEKEKFYNDASIKYLMRTMSLTKALTITQAKFNKVRKTVSKADEKILKQERRDYVKKNFKGQAFFNRVPIMGGTPYSGVDRFAPNLEAKAGILMADEQVAGLTKRRQSMVGERNNRKKEYGKKLTSLSSATTEKEKRLIKQQLDLMEEELRLRNNNIQSIKEELKVARDDRDLQIKNAEGKGFRVKGSGSYRTFEDLNPMEKAQLKYIKYREKVEAKVAGIRAGLKMFFSRGNLGLLMNVIGRFAMVMGYAILAITGIALLIYIMKKTGVWDKLAQWIETVRPLFEEFYVVFKESVVGFFTSIWSFLTSIWKIIEGLYTGDNNMIKKGFYDGAVALKDIALNALTAIGSLMFILIGGAVGLIGAFFGSVIQVIWAGVGALASALGKTATASTIGAVVGGTAGFFLSGGNPLGAVAGAAVGGALVGGITSQMVSGGTTITGGNYLVGENGPEIVTLPGGTNVTNNTNTRSALGHTINVHVNGRIGASEQELNDIANKIGHKISINMNRFSSTGMRG